MRRNTAAYVGAILLMLLVLTATGMISEDAMAEGSGDYPAPTSGDWNVHNDTMVENETIILNGNLTVYAGATLTFRNATLKMNSTSSQYYAIEILDGATFKILDIDNDNTTTADASVVERNNSSNPYFFRVYDGAAFEMRNSELHGCGDATTVVKYAGLYIETDNATIDHNLISNNYMGIVLYGSDATISNNTITWNDDTGIFAGAWSNGTIENNWITWNDGYGIWVTGIDNTPPQPWPSNPTIINNVITDTGRGKDTAVGIQIEYSCKPFIKDTKILRSTEDGLYSSDGSTPTLINVTIDGGNYGIASSNTGYIYVCNTTISDTNLYDLSIQGAPGSFFIVTNSTFNESKVIMDSSGNLTVRWYLHVYVEDSNNQPIPVADVRVRDNENGTYDKNFTTDDNGYVKWIVLKEYWANKTTKIYYTPYNMTVNYSGLNFTDNPRDTDMNTSKTEVFTATTPVPEFDSILIPIISVIVVVLSFFRKKKNRYR